MAELSGLVADAVRRERGRIVSSLLRFCRDLDAAEDAFQDAVESAMASWTEQVPDNPGAWLMSAAKNRVRDAARHQAIASTKLPAFLEVEMQKTETIDTVSDDHLRLIFTCCHPVLSRDNQVALTLKVVAGFSLAEISRAFVCSEETTSQRILRAKQSIQKSGVAYEIPTHEQLASRVTAVLGVVYAIFNEGHTAKEGTLMRLDLQAEALRLGRLVCDLLPASPEAFGLVAMMAFGAARAATRVDGDGVPILLADQDRSQWDRALLREGLMALARARSLGGGASYVLQAELAALHVTAPGWNDTDWSAIVALYDALLATSSSPIVALNRAVAVSMRDGASAGLVELEGLEGALADYHLFYATRAELSERAGVDSTVDLERALLLVTNDGERRLLQRRLARRKSRLG